MNWYKEYVNIVQAQLKSLTWEGSISFLNNELTHRDAKGEYDICASGGINGLIYYEETEEFFDKYFLHTFPKGNLFGLNKNEFVWDSFHYHINMIKATIELIMIERLKDILLEMGKDLIDIPIHSVEYLDRKERIKRFAGYIKQLRGEYYE